MRVEPFIPISFLAVICISPLATRLLPTASVVSVWEVALNALETIPAFIPGMPFSLMLFKESFPLAMVS